MNWHAWWMGSRTEAIAFVTTYGLKLVGAIALAVIGWFVAGWIERKVRRFGEKSEHVDRTLIPLLSKLARLAVLAIVIVGVLDNLGVDTASVLAFLGAAGLAVGLALKDTAADVAGGIVLLVLRPIAVGESVQIGATSGVVSEIGIFQTELVNFEGVPVILPNSKVRTSEIQNFTRAGKRRIDLRIPLPYGADLDRAVASVLEVVRGDPRVMAEPAPIVDVGNLSEHAVDVMVQAWAKPEDSAPTKLALARRIRQRLDADGIEAPFATRIVRAIGP